MTKARRRHAPSCGASTASGVSSDRVPLVRVSARDPACAFAAGTPFLNVKAALLERVGLVAVGGLLVLLFAIWLARKIRRATLRQNPLAEDRLEEIASARRRSRPPSPQESQTSAPALSSEADTVSIPRQVGPPGMFAPRKSSEQEPPAVSGTPPWEPAPRPPDR